jgi:hypothetical protein
VFSNGVPAFTEFVLCSFAYIIGFISLIPTVAKVIALQTLTNADLKDVYVSFYVGRLISCSLLSFVGSGDNSVLFLFY